MVQDVVGYVSSKARGLVGACQIPGNSDIAMMALALAAKSDGDSVLKNCSMRPEATAMIGALAQLGVAVTRQDDSVTVVGGSLHAHDQGIQVGQSQVMLASIAGITAGAAFRTQLEGSAKPGSVMDALRSLGARVDGPMGADYPITVGGSGLTGGSHTLSDPDTAVKVAFFLAGLDAPGDIHLVQNAAGDEDLEVLLKTAGVGFEKDKEVGKEGYHLVMSGGARPAAAMHDLPGDPTAALYLLGLATMLPRSELVLHSVGNDWKTRRALELLRRFNAQIEIQVDRSESKFPIRTVIAKPSDLRRTRIGAEQASLFLDEVPFLAVMGTRASGETVIRDAQKLREGDVDCLSLMAQNLRLLGAKVGEMPDGLVVQGPVSLQGAELDAGGDSRVAVALALAGMAAEGETQIAHVGSLLEDFKELFSCLATVVNAKR
jgi:3-phosphoshikimate 1-carboxyvinyltransferase